MKLLGKCGAVALIGLALLGSLAHAATPTQTFEIQRLPRIAVPGAPGWKPTCSTQFVVSNYVKSSNIFANGTGTASWVTPWAADTSAPSVTAFPTGGSGGDSDPNGGTNATDISFPAVGAGGHTVFWQTLNNSQTFPFTIQVWAKDLTPAVAGNVYLIVRNSGGTVFKSTPIPNTGIWGSKPIVFNVPWATFGASTYQLGIGVDRRDATETNIPTQTKSVAIYRMEAVPYPRGPGGGAWPYVDAPGTAVPYSANFTINCPVGVAFRDWGRIQAWKSAWNVGGAPFNLASGVTFPAAGENYQRGGVSQPFLGGASLQVSGSRAGQRCGHASMTDGVVQGTSPGQHNDWYNDGIYCSPTASIFDQAEIAPGSPQIQLPGAMPYPASPIAVTGGSFDNSGNVTLTLASPPTGVVPGGAVYVTGLTGTGSVSFFNVNYNGAAGVGNSVVSVSGNTITATGPTGKGTGTFTGGSAAVQGQSLASIYMLHPWWWPGKCNVGGVDYGSCMHFSAEDTGSSNPGVYLAYAPTIDGTWQIYGGANPIRILNETQNGNANHPGLPADIQVGNLVYEITQGVSANGSPFQLWSYPACTSTPCATGVGTAGTYVASMTQPCETWDADSQGGCPSRLDPGIYKNRCTVPSTGDGFYELEYTAYRAGPQYGQYTINSGTYDNTSGLVTLTLASSITAAPGTPVAISGTNGSGTGFGGLMGTYVTVGSTNGTTLQYNAGSGKCSSGCSIFNDSLGLGGTYKNQAIFQMVSDSMLGPWFLDNSGPIIPLNSAMYNGISTFGEFNVFHQGSLLFAMGNTDNGTAVSIGVGGFMQDACN